MRRYVLHVLLKILIILLETSDDLDYVVLVNVASNNTSESRMICEQTFHCYYYLSKFLHLLFCNKYDCSKCNCETGIKYKLHQMHGSLLLLLLPLQMI